MLQANKMQAQGNVSNAIIPLCFYLQTVHQTALAIQRTKNCTTQSAMMGFHANILTLDLRRSMTFDVTLEAFKI